MASRLYGCEGGHHDMSQEEITLHRVFDMYSVTPGDHRDSCMRFINLPLLTKFLNDLSVHSPVLKDVDPELVKAFFALVDRDCDGKISYMEFAGWWKSEFSQRSRYRVFESREIFRAGWRLFQRFAIGRSIPYRRFEYMMDYLRIHLDDTDFDVLDVNADGVLSFSEFSDWIKWY